ncbi:MAG TPA: VWA domain-containing protein [Blastocatellia bacterium]|nr:VWA domain-containing protein [Blastocatellia bacterium]
MKSRLVIVMIVAVMLGSLLLPTFAQTKQPPQKKNDKQTPQKPGDDQGLGIGITEIQLPVTVTDDKDRPIRELKKEDFQVYEDGVLQPITRFEANSDRPLDIAIMMDISNSVRPKLKYEREAAGNFVETILRKRRDRVLFGTFNDQIELRQDFTEDSEKVYNAINDKALKAQGETKLFDAVYRLCEEKVDNVRTASSTGRRGVIIVITDGDDTASERSLQEAISMAQNRGVPIYGISTKAGGFFGVQAGQVLNAEDKELRRLTRETGGDLYFPGTMTDLERTFTEINVNWRSQYLITYRPEKQDADGKFRKIEVKLDRTQNPNFKYFIVKTREGYKAIPQGKLGSGLQ